MSPLLTRRRLIRRARALNCHSSSRFDRTSLSLFTAARTYLAGHTYCSFTEVSNDTRVASLGKFPGWKLCNVQGKGGRDECASLVRTSVWDILDIEAIALNDGIPAPTSGWHTIYALVVTVRHRWTRQVIKRLTVHMPAHVEGDGKFRTGPDSLAYKECIVTLRQLVAKWQADPTVDHVELGGDWNLDWRKQWVRSYFAMQFPSLTCNWEGRLPTTGGTHGDSRIIDFFLADYSWTESALMLDDASSDHRPFEATGYLRQLVAA